ncbi:MAG: sigma-70 family RNA polymerase sigma factor [Sphingobacteriales bacterium]|nr:sigma-70 family RNA polymerase sigma factor [Sphingobacteriales bacterium]
MRKPFYSDEQLISRYINGDESSLITLVKRYQTRLFSYICYLVKDRTVAEDIFQDVFLKVIIQLKTKKYNEEGKFYQWIVRISRNMVIDYFRNSNKNPTVTDTAGNDILSYIRIPDTNREDEIIEDEIQYMLKKMINALPHEQREVLILRHYANMSFKDIAELTHVSINTALGRMRYALINLRKMMITHNIQLSV